MLDPPSLAGTDQDTTTAVLLGSPLIDSGAVGTVAGVTAAEATDAGDGPTLLRAVTVKV